VTWRWGQFVFFGDAELLARIQPLLTEGEEGPPATGP
jgi:hypothetical protein